MTKRLLIVILIILVVVAAALPPLLGIVYERQVHSQAASAPENDYLRLELREYERGFYTSRGSVRLGLSDDYVGQISSLIAQEDPSDPPSAEEQAEIDGMIELLRSELHLDFDVRHGPVMFADGVKFGLATVRSELQPAGGRLAALKEAVNVPHLLLADTVVAFDGSSDFRASVPPVSHTADEMRLDFSGLTSQGNFHYRQRRIKATGDSQIIELTVDDGRMAIEGITFDIDSRMLTDNLWLGTSQANVAKIDLTGPENVGVIAIRDVGMGGNIDLNEAGDKLSASFDYRIAGIDGPPDVDLADMHVGLRLSDIDLEAAKDYMRLYQQLALSPSEDMRASFAELQSVGERILRGSPTAEIKPIKFSWNGEQFQSNVSLRFDGTVLPAGAGLDTLQANPELLFGAVTGEGRIEASEVLAGKLMAGFARNQIVASIPEDAEVADADIEAAANAQAEAMVTQLIGQGLIERADGVLRTRLEYSNGRFLVNGAEFPLMEALQPGAAQ